MNTRTIVVLSIVIALIAIIFTVMPRPSFDPILKALKEQRSSTDEQLKIDLEKKKKEVEILTEKNTLLKADNKRLSNERFVIQQEVSRLKEDVRKAKPPENLEQAKLLMESLGYRVVLK